FLISGMNASTIWSIALLMDIDEILAAPESLLRRAFAAKAATTRESSRRWRAQCREKTTCQPRVGSRASPPPRLGRSTPPEAAGPPCDTLSGVRETCAAVLTSPDGRGPAQPSMVSER